MNKQLELSAGLDQLILQYLEKTNIYLKTKKPGDIEAKLDQNPPEGFALGCSLKEFIDNGWSLMENKKCRHGVFIDGKECSSDAEVNLINFICDKIFEIKAKEYLEKTMNDINQYDIQSGLIKLQTSLAEYMRTNDFIRSELEKRIAALEEKYQLLIVTFENSVEILRDKIANDVYTDQRLRRKQDEIISKLEAQIDDLLKTAHSHFTRSWLE